MLKEKAFTPYQVLLIAVLAILQFTIVLDFMVLSPLGAQLMPELEINTQQFGWVVSAYAFSAGISGLLAAGFADRYDRKHLLLFFYTGFIAGTFLCGIAPNYMFLLFARIITGIFGGVIGSVVFAIITDSFEMQYRGRVMGFVQMAFAVSQILGLPAGLYFANLWGWHAPFLMIVLLGLPLFAVIGWKIRPVNKHLELQGEHSAKEHLKNTLTTPRYIQGFVATTLLATGGFMLMPFGSAFAVNNLAISLNQLPMVYMVTGVVSMVAGPLIGRLSDAIGSFRVFAGGSLLSIVLVITYTNLGVTPLWMIIALNAVLFVGITSRMISSSALLSGVPAPAYRGAFMGINASVSQISGGIATAVAGMIVYQNETGKLENYPLLGLVVAVTMVICVYLLRGIDRMVKKDKAPTLPVEISVAETALTKEH